MADGTLLFKTALDESGLVKGLNGIKGVAQTAFGVSAKAVTAISGALSAGTAASVKFGSQFETTFAKASTLFGDVSVDTDNLNKKILEMSSVSGVAASDINETLYQAMSAGIPVTEDMGKALDAVNTANKLAVGGYTSSATAMQALTGAINAYNLPASDAKRISDELITVQNKGVTTVDDLATNMGRAISTASAYSVNLENLNAGYISLTKSNIATAEATTYMSSMFNELGDSGSDVSKILQDKTGMTFGQLMNSGGTLADVMDILSESVNGDSEALINLWGSAEAGKAANAIVQQGTDAFRQSLDDLTNSTGATENAYETMMDTFEGKKSILFETAKNLGISIYEGFQENAKGMLDVANSYMSELQAGFDENGTTGLVETLGGVISQLITRAAEYAPQMVILAVMLIQSLVTGLNENVGQIMSAGASILGSLINGIITCIPLLGSLAYNVITTLLEGFVNDSPRVMESGAQTLAGFMNGISDKLPELIPLALDAILTFAQSIVDNLPTIVQAGLDMLVSLAEGIANALPILIEKVPKIINSFCESLYAMLPKILLSGAKIIIELGKGIINSIPTIIANAGEIVEAIFNVITLCNLFSAGKKIIASLGEGLGSATGNIFQIIKDTAKKIAQNFKEVNWISVGSDIIKGVISGIKAAAGNLLQAAEDAAKGAIDAMKKKLGIHSPSRVAKKEVGKQVPDGAAEGVKENKNSMVEAAEEAAEESIGAMKGVLSTRIFNPEVSFGNGIRSNIQNSFGTIQANLKGTGAEIKTRQGIDYNRMGEAMAYAMERSGFKVEIGQREFGRIVREVMA